MRYSRKHDEFIWALLFSLIINLLLVFALLSHSYESKLIRLHPIPVSIESRPRLDSTATSHQTLSNRAIVSTIQARRADPSPTLNEPSESAKPEMRPQPTTISKESVDSTHAAAEIEENVTTATSFTNDDENLTPLADKIIAEGRSILGDKSAEDYYTAPVYLVGDKPPYPRLAAHHGWEGTVLLTLQINANGTVEKVEIAKSSGHKILDQEARRCVRAWRFSPARHNGIAIPATVQQPIVFRPAPPEKSP